MTWLKYKTKLRVYIPHEGNHINNLSTLWNWRVIWFLGCKHKCFFREDDFLLACKFVCIGAKWQYFLIYMLKTFNLCPQSCKNAQAQIFRALIGPKHPYQYHLWLSGYLEWKQFFNLVTFMLLEIFKSSFPMQLSYHPCNNSKISYLW